MSENHAADHFASFAVPHLHPLDYSCHCTPSTPIFNDNNVSTVTEFHTGTPSCAENNRMGSSYTDINLTLLHYDSAMRLLDVEQNSAFSQLTSVLDCSSIRSEQCFTSPVSPNSAQEVKKEPLQVNSFPLSTSEKKKKQQSKKFPIFCAHVGLYVNISILNRENCIEN